MKYLKKFNENSGLVKYSFYFPVYKKYEIKDDGYWNWDEVCDFLSQNGVNLKSDIASELGIDEREVTDENIDEFVNTYGGKRLGSWEKFKDDYGLVYEDNDLSREDYETMMRDFNDGKLEQYFDEDPSFEFYNLKLVEPKRKGFYGYAYGEFETDIELSVEQIESVKSYITGQCSDGWGEGFEQQSDTEEINGLRFETSIHPWKMNNWKVVISKI